VPTEASSISIGGPSGSGPTSIGVGRGVPACMHARIAGSSASIEGGAFHSGTTCSSPSPSSIRTSTTNGRLASPQKRAYAWASRPVSRAKTRPLGA
jgi:hypothetical protein